MYLFEMTNGKQKLAYGASPEDALKILEMRLTPDEMSLILRDQFKRIPQREMLKHINNLG
ncbi:MAG: hypothetical protein JXN59_07110 [Anaerolineae bacterium]|nr:hypothetical protein [Anaerolineae bacterium]